MSKNKFKKGMRIRLLKMNDHQAPPAGTEGTVDFVDDAGQIHMFWDNGSRLALVPELDEFSVLGRYKAVYYENLAHVFYVDAENKEEAEEIFMRQIENGEYDFSDGEVIETEYEIKKITKEGRTMTRKEAIEELKEALEYNESWRGFDDYIPISEEATELALEALEKENGE